jgi:hypothetical protein
MEDFVAYGGGAMEVDHPVHGLLKRCNGSKIISVVLWCGWIHRP